MSNNKQSSIDWLINEHFGGIENCTPDFRHKIKQAKAMHKEEMEDFFKKGMFLVEGHLWKPIDKFEEFYNKTFGGEK